MFRFVSVLVVAVALSLTPSDATAAVKFPWSKSKDQAQPAKPTKAQKKEIARVGRDVQRLESLLANLKTSAKLSDKSWKSFANEADMLANRIYTNVKSATTEKNALNAAKQLRTHVQNMKKEAEKRDYRSTRRHAERALSVAAQLDEWAS
jgi:predicted RNase H-like nuclease (RuvC/YqgF family)